MRDEFRKSDDTSRRGVTARDRFGRVLITHDNDASLPSSSFQSTARSNPLYKYRYCPQGGIHILSKMVQVCCRHKG